MILSDKLNKYIYNLISYNNTINNKGTLSLTENQIDNLGNNTAIKLQTFVFMEGSNPLLTITLNEILDDTKDYIFGIWIKGMPGTSITIENHSNFDTITKVGINNWEFVNLNLLAKNRIHKDKIFIILTENSTWYFCKPILVEANLITNIELKTGNNKLLINDNYNNLIYNNFKTYLDKYINYAQLEEEVNNISYKHIPILQLYSIFELLKYIHELLQLTDINNNNIYTVEYLYNKYEIKKLGAELQKINININDIIKLFNNNIISTDLLSYQNKNHNISKLKKLILQPIEIITDVDIDDDTYEIIYKNTNKTVAILAGYSNAPRPIIDLEWKEFSLYLRRNNNNYVEWHWNKNNTPKIGTQIATITNIAGQIQFMFTSSMLDNLSTGIYDLRLFYIDNNDNSDILENTNAINIKL